MYGTPQSTETLLQAPQILRSFTAILIYREHGDRIPTHAFSEVSITHSYYNTFSMSEQQLPLILSIPTLHMTNEAYSNRWQQQRLCSERVTFRGLKRHSVILG